MRIYRSLSELPHLAPAVVATIGNFDGVHRGHQWVIRQVLSHAAAEQRGSMVITFDPHPARAIRPDLNRRLITPTDTKLRLLAQTGVDATVVLPFTDDLSRMSARDFARVILREQLNVVELHEGENFRFGHQAEAGVDTLQQLGAELGFKLFSYAPERLHGASISSTRIRDLIAMGDVSLARRLLGRPFSVQSTAASGRGYGSRYAVPTINLATYDELLPAHGVYITQLMVGVGTVSEVFQGVTNVGNRPTFGADSFAVESHLFDFHPLELTAQTPLELCFLRFLRPERRWENPEALREQIGKDVGAAVRFFRLVERRRSVQYR